MSRKRTGRRAGSQRLCAACRRRLPRGTGLRLVQAGDGDIVPDLFGKLPGRGVTVCAQLACLRQAVERRALHRALRGNPRNVDPDALARAFVEAGRQQVAAMLATAARSGWLCAGADNVRQALRDRQLALVLLAEDASESLAEGIMRLASERAVPCYRLLTVSELAHFHRGKPLAVSGILHRGLAARLDSELDKTTRLVRSVAGESTPAPRQLTGRSVRGNMPHDRARSGTGRS